jgi:hypothetical protein
MEFNSNGNWKEADGNHLKLPYGFIPASIRNYSTKNFPNTCIIKQYPGWDIAYEFEGQMHYFTLAKNKI